MDIVKPANESNFSSKFKREERKKKQSVYTFEEGEMWVEVLLAQLEPISRVFSEECVPDNSGQLSHSKFDVESDLARILLEIGPQE